jgi:hypothetical protein
VRTSSVGGTLEELIEWFSVLDIDQGAVDFEQSRRSCPHPLLHLHCRFV